MQRRMNEQGRYREDAPPLALRKRGVVSRFVDWLMAPAEVPAAPAPRALPPERREQIREALREWQAATAYFESVTDPALVDYAVYDMEAAEKRYMYLLQSARKG